MTIDHKKAQDRGPLEGGEGTSFGGWMDRVFSRGLLFKGSEALACLSGIIMIILVLLVCVDVVGHNTPLRVPWAAGTYEIAELFMSIITAFGLSYCWYKGGHVRIELVLERLPPGPRALFEMITSALAFVFVGAIGWRLTVLAANAVQRGEQTDFIKLPVGVFMLVFSAAMIHFALVLAWFSVAHLREFLKGRERNRIRTAR